jgi:hypothetical protein
MGCRTPLLGGNLLVFWFLLQRLTFTTNYYQILVRFSAFAVVFLFQSKSASVYLACALCWLFACLRFLVKKLLFS